MRKLVGGIHRFQSGVFGEQNALFGNRAEGQKPDASTGLSAEERRPRSETER